MSNSPVTISSPGEILREMLQNRGLHAEAFALATGIPYPHMQGILDGQKVILPEHAERFERILNVGADFWLKRQSAYRQAILDADLQDPEKRKLIAESMVKPLRGYFRR